MLLTDSITKKKLVYVTWQILREGGNGDKNVCKKSPPVKA